MLTTEKKIIFYSPYPLNPLYPAYFNLIRYFAEKHKNVCVYSPFVQNGLEDCRIETVKLKGAAIKGLKHILSSMDFVRQVWARENRSGYAIWVFAFGPVNVFFSSFLRMIKSVRVVSYQPELFEPKLSVFLPFYLYGCSKADFFIDVNNERAIYRQREFKTPIKQLRLLPNYPLEVEINSDFKCENNKEGPLKLVYGGSISPEHDIENLLEVVSLDRFKDVLELTIFSASLVPSSKYEKSLIGRFNRSSNIYWNKGVPRNIFLKRLKEYDVGFCSYPYKRKGFVDIAINSYLAAPGKVYDYLSQGLKVVVGNHPTLTDLVEQGLVKTFLYGEIESLKEAIIDLLGDKRNLNQFHVDYAQIESLTLDRYIKSIDAFVERYEN